MDQPSHIKVYNFSHSYVISLKAKQFYLPSLEQGGETNVMVKQESSYSSSPATCRELSSLSLLLEAKEE